MFCRASIFPTNHIFWLKDRCEWKKLGKGRKASKPPNPKTTKANQDT